MRSGLRPAAGTTAGRTFDVRLLLGHGENPPYFAYARLLALDALLHVGPALEELGELAGRGKEQRALQWCERHYPECLALVPRRRREQFVHGLLGARAAQAARRARRLPRGAEVSFDRLI